MASPHNYEKFNELLHSAENVRNPEFSSHRVLNAPNFPETESNSDIRYWPVRERYHHEDRVATQREIINKKSVNFADLPKLFLPGEII